MWINDDVTLDDASMDERFVRASGPGGQNVNKLSTAVELRVQISGLQGMTAAALARLRRLAGRRLSDSGVLVIRADRYRTQELNRADARERFLELVRNALVVPKTRVRTKPSRAVRERRLEAKSKRSQIKRQRQKKPDLS